MSYPQPVAALRVTFLNFGRITVDILDLKSAEAKIVKSHETQLDSDHPRADFRAGTKGENFAALLYTFELWDVIYPLQNVQALGGKNPYVLDPAPGLPHAAGANRGIPPLQEVSFSARKLARRDVVKLGIAKPGVATTVTIDRDLSCFSVTLLVPQGTEAYINFDTWPGTTRARTFKV